jgi:thiol-disulfide isomerase/thioredoxin
MFKSNGPLRVKSGATLFAAAAMSAVTCLTAAAIVRAADGPPGPSAAVSSATAGKIAQTIAAVSAGAVTEPPRPGERIADFTLPLAATGQPRSLTDLEHGAKAVALIFVSTQCPVSKDYNARMEQLATDYAAKGVRVVGVDANHRESPDDIVRYAAANGLTFPILKDDGNRIADRLDAQVTPEVYLLNGSGVLLFHGPIDDDRDGTNITQRYLREALDATIGNKPVPVKTARAFGCSIKRVASAF